METHCPSHEAAKRWQIQYNHPLRSRPDLPIQVLSRWPALGKRLGRRRVRSQRLWHRRFAGQTLGLLSKSWKPFPVKIIHAAAPCDKARRGYAVSGFYAKPLGFWLVVLWGVVLPPVGLVIPPKNAYCMIGPYGQLHF